MITQNYDNYHAELLKSSDVIKDDLSAQSDHEYITKDVYEIQGNLMYMRCFKKCSLAVVPTTPRDSNLDIEDQIPK